MNNRQSETASRHGTLKIVKAMVPAIVAQIARRHGAAAADLIAAWPEIVGDELARICRPKAISAGSKGYRQGDRTLTLIAARAQALDLEYQSTDILARVNAYLGAGAITRIKVEPGEITARAPAPSQPKPITPDERGLDDIEDSGLRGALARLQGAITTNRSGRK